jgi:AcrR family transcriptional regulator
VKPGSSAVPQGAGHRERLLAAMAASIEEKGYRETFVGDVVRLARTSRRSFYEHFSDREDCFLALFDATNEALIEQVAASVQPERPWDEQVDVAVGAYLDAVAARPALSHSFVRELPALGREGEGRQRAGIERFADLLVSLVESGRRVQPEVASHPLARDTAIIIVGGLRELMIIAAEQGRDVREVRPVAAQAVMAILDATVLHP